MSEKCKEMVWHEWRHDFLPCSRNAKRDGYCTQHHPDSVKERRLKQEAAWKRERENSPWNRLTIAEKRIEKLKNALTWILPMAKGYADKNDVGRNREIIRNAESLLTEQQPEG